MRGKIITIFACCALMGGFVLATPGGNAANSAALNPGATNPGVLGDLLDSVFGGKCSFSLLHTVTTNGDYRNKIGANASCHQI